MKPLFQWNLGTRSVELGRRTLIMGVVNVTPDSFSDGGQFLDPERAIEHASRLLVEGADIIDIGGESTRPGARVGPGPAEQPASNAVRSSKIQSHEGSVSAEEELRRVIPVICRLKKEHPATIISVDTYKARVAQEAFKCGAEIVNDVSGFRWDPEMKKTIAELRCGAILMHMRGRPEEWRTLPPLDDVVGLVKAELKAWSEDALSAGVQRDRIVLDPGFGFGKSYDENYPLIARFEQLQVLGFPLLAGTSRKSFIGRTISPTDQNIPPQQRLHGTLATETALILKGACIIRTHDVRPSVEAARIADAILTAE